MVGAAAIQVGIILVEDAVVDEYGGIFAEHATAAALPGIVGRKGAGVNAHRRIGAVKPAAVDQRLVEGEGRAGEQDAPAFAEQPAAVVLAEVV